MRNYSARETEWMLELDGIELASFWQRAFAFLIDWILIGVIFTVLAGVLGVGYVAYMHRQGKSVDDIKQTFSTTEDGDGLDLHVHSGKNVKTYRWNSENAKLDESIKIVTDVLLPVLYFGTLLWKGKGRTPGKRLMKIRVVSIVHRHLSFWHSVERALGYGAAALEGGFGFIQFFIHPYRRCAQDRLAETMVVTERGYQAMEHKLQHALLPDSEANMSAPE